MGEGKANHLAGLLGLGIAPNDGDLLASTENLAGVDHLGSLLLNDGSTAGRGIDHNLLVRHFDSTSQKKNKKNVQKKKESVTR